MKRYNIYEGHLSCHAANDGVYVPGKGVDLVTGSSIAALILWDYYRGYTYDHSCRRVPMDWGLAESRLIYLIALCAKHTHHSPECRELKEIVEYARFHRRLPPYAEVVLAGPNAERVAEELRRLGIASNVKVLSVPKPVVPRPERERPVSVPGVKVVWIPVSEYFKKRRKIGLSR